MPDVVMPRLSDSMEEGTILTWLKADGDAVAVGDELAEIETDDATQTCEARSAGVLRIVAGEGTTVAVGQAIATLAADGDGDGDGASAAAGAERTPVEPAIAAAPAPAPAAATSSAPGRGGTAKGEVSEQELTRAQQVIARRTAESKATIPDFSITTEIDMERCVDLRAQLGALGGATPSYDDMVVRACGLALREHPKANGSYRDGKFLLHSRVNVGIAVATEGSLVVPTVFDADRKPLAQLADETRALAERVRAGVVTAAELSGGTFTVSSTGMHGVTEFRAVINPPQAAILGVGAPRPVPVVRDGAVVVRHVLAATLVCDHRILYGAEAAGFLARVRELLEAPATLLA